ncbi:MAG: aminotransferase class V-fold PLP-dependent enzyme [Desulfovibrionales bacterium]
MLQADKFEKYFISTEIKKGDAEAVLASLMAHDISFPRGVTSKLEEKIREWLHIEYALAHCNGSAAMLAAMYGCGIRDGDEVICPSYTWWASVSPALVLGAKPVFCEVNDQNLTLDVQDARKRITSRTKAIVVPHLWGNYADILNLRDIVRGNSSKIYLIEDVSHSLGAKIDSMYLGTLGDVAIFSMQAQKILTAGEGGMLITDNQDIYERAVYLGHYERIKEIKNPEWHKYQKTGGGYKFRIHPLGSALALSQLQDLTARLKKQKELNAYFVDRLQELNALSLYNYNPDDFEQGGIINFKARFNAGKPAEERLEKLFVKRDYFPLLHKEPFFLEASAQSGGHGRLPVTEDLHRSLYSLPVFLRGDRQSIDHYIDGIKQALGINY